MSTIKDVIEIGQSLAWSNNRYFARIAELLKQEGIDNPNINQVIEHAKRENRDTFQTLRRIHENNPATAIPGN